MSFRLPAAVSPRFFLPGALALPLRTLGALFCLAQRAFAAAASFARVAADIGLRLRERRLRLVSDGPVPKSDPNRSSRATICCRIVSAWFNFWSDKSIRAFQ